MHDRACSNSIWRLDVLNTEACRWLGDIHGWTLLHPRIKSLKRYYLKWFLEAKGVLYITLICCGHEFKTTCSWAFITRASMGKPESKMQAVLGRQKRGHGPRRSMRRPWKLGMRKRDSDNALRTVRMRCFTRKVLARIASYTFISHTKMSIVFGKDRSSNYIAWKPASQASKVHARKVLVLISVASDWLSFLWWSRFH